MSTNPEKAVMSSELDLKYPELIGKIKSALSQCGCHEESITVTILHVLDESDDYLSVEVRIQFDPIHSDDGLITPDAHHHQFDRDGDEWFLIIGEDTQSAITYGNLFSSLYFNSLIPDCEKAGLQASRSALGDESAATQEVNFHTTVGVVLGYCCTALDNGIDIRKEEMPKMLADIEACVKTMNPAPAVKDALPVKWGPFRHNNGVICCGTLRVARADFDNDASPEVQKEILDALCSPAVPAGEPVSGEAMYNEYVKAMGTSSEAWEDLWDGEKYAWTLLTDKFTRPAGAVPVEATLQERGCDKKCQCDSEYWFSTLPPPVVCNQFIRDDDYNYCKHCQHDEACHLAEGVKR